MNNCNLEMMCTKALALGKKIQNLDSSLPFFEVLKDHDKCLYNFASGTNAIFADDEGFDIFDLKNVDSVLHINTFEDFIRLANFEPFSEAVDRCEELRISIDHVRYVYKYKHLDKFLQEADIKIITANLKRKLKYLIYKQNGKNYLVLFHLYSSRKNLDDDVKQFV